MSQARSARSDEDSIPLDTIADAVQAIARGEMVVVVDDPDRENEGDVVMAAEHASAASVNFMLKHARGLICVPMEATRLEALAIPPMVRGSGDRHGTAFHVGVDRVGSQEPASAAERARAVRALADPASERDDFVRPGRIFPLAARAGGVLARRGHTEAAVDLARLAGCAPAGLICEIADEDGEMARLPELRRFACRHGLMLVSIEDLVAYRGSRESLLERGEESRLVLPMGRFRSIPFRDPVTGREHLALVLGDVARRPDAIVRVHPACFAGDVLHAAACQCAGRLHAALERIAAQGAGVVVYLRGVDDLLGCSAGAARPGDALAATQILTALGVSREARGPRPADSHGARRHRG